MHKENTSLIEIDKKLSSLQDKQIQKVYSYSHYIVIELYGKGVKDFLYIARGDIRPHLIFELKKPIKTEKFREKFVDLVKSMIIDKIFISARAEIDEGVFFIEFARGDDLVHMAFMYTSSGLIFEFIEKSIQGTKTISSSSRKFTDISEKSWTTRTFEEEFKSKYLDNIKTCKLEYSLSSNEFERAIENLNFKKEIKQNRKSATKKLKIQEDILRLKSAIDVLKKSISSEPIANSLVVNSKKIKLDKFSTDWKKKEFIFELIKKYNNGIVLQEKRLNEDATEIETGKISNTAFKVVNPIWKEKVELKINTEDEIETIISDENCMIKIGKTSNANQKLLTSWSKGADYWAHLENYPSAHAFIRILKKAQIDIEATYLPIVAKRLIELSKIRELNMVVIYTQRKWVKPVKNAQGLVNILKFKRFTYKAPRN